MDGCKPLPGTISFQMNGTTRCTLFTWAWDGGWMIPRVEAES